MIRISSPAALNAWLGERYDFGDGHLARVERSPNGAVTLRLEQYVRRGWQPGDVSEVDVYELVTDAPIEFETPDRHDPGYVLEGVDTEDLNGRMVIRIDLWPERLRLVADEVIVRHVTMQRRRTDPWVGDEFTVATDAAHDDRFWSSRVTEVLGTPVVWRIFGGRDPRAAGLDIDGCFLQTFSQLATTDYGAFCVRSRDGHTTLSQWGEVDANLWGAVRLVAAGFSRIRSGNCVFESADWASYLAENEFPPDERLRS